ncbi:galactose-1-phosphate uridylyltransferase [bacterium]|nr:galactose-1-phosphate uridylyltransferase [bacterium]
MSELRHDPVQKRWVIVAIERARRPTDFKKDPSNGHVPSVCPFCEGNEDKTPPEITAIRPSGTEANSPGWKIRVIPNKFPALAVEGDLGRRGLGIFDVMNGVGAHEVIIESPDHTLHMGDMPIEHLFKICKIYRDRISDLHKDNRLRYVLIFKNHGKTAGASLAHPHTQLIATPITPRTIAAELDSAREHYLNKERCLFCDIMNQELAMQERIVLTTDQFVVLEPYASRFPFETWIMPRIHSHDYTQTTDEVLMDFATVLGETLRRIKVALDDPPYNFVLHTSPNSVLRPGKEHYWKTLPYDWHWHLEIIPRLTKVAGFEWGTGFYINPTPPEVAAEYLRSLQKK